jgi:hypothetical protein
LGNTRVGLHSAATTATVTTAATAIFIIWAIVRVFATAAAATATANPRFLTGKGHKLHSIQHFFEVSHKEKGAQLPDAPNRLFCGKSYC